MSRVRAARAARRGPARRRRPWSRVVGDSAAYLSVLAFLRVVAEATAAVLDHPRRRRPGRGHLAAAAHRHRRSWRSSRSSSSASRRAPWAASTSTRSRSGAAPVVVWLRRVLGPVARLLVALGNAVTPGQGLPRRPVPERVRAARPASTWPATRALIEAGEREMIHSVFELGDTVAREVMVPAHRHGHRSTTTRRCRQAMSLFLRSGFSRIPVRRRRRRRRRRAALPQGRRAPAQRRPRGRRRCRSSELMRPMHFVPESKPVDDLLREMQRDQTHFAVVVDEYGGTAGPGHHRGHPRGDRRRDRRRVRPRGARGRGPRRRRAPGRRPRMDIDDLAELFDVDIDEDEVDTVGGLHRQDHRPGADPRLHAARWPGSALDRRADGRSPAPDRHRHRRAGRRPDADQRPRGPVAHGGDRRPSEHGDGAVTPVCRAGSPASSGAPTPASRR